MDQSYSKMLTPTKKNFELGATSSTKMETTQLPDSKKNFSASYIPIDSDPEAQYLGKKLRIIPQTTFVIKKKSKKLKQNFDIQAEKEKL